MGVLIKPNVQILFLAPPRTDYRFPTRSFLKYLKVNGSCSSLPSRTLWILPVVPGAGTHWGTGRPISLPSLPFHLEFLNPVAAHAYSCSSRPLLGPESWARICSDGKDGISVSPALLSPQVIVGESPYSHSSKSMMEFQTDWTLWFSSHPWPQSQRSSKLTDCKSGRRK